ncbi:MAG TPA: ATP-binding protein [Thermoanaerobaculia bacterium]|nr:ATP-binding protein [Thermoanaerobaculia bacterium]
MLILAPTGRDAELACGALQSAGLTAEDVPDVEALCRGVDEGCGALIITEEALDAHAMRCLHDVLDRQPAWSDPPLLIFTSRPSAELAVRSFEQLGARANITMIERPIRVKTMISAARAALRARRRQYEVRDLVSELEHRVEERDNFLAMLSHELRNPLAAITLAVDSLNDRTTISNEHAILVRQTRHLAKLVDDLLDIARVTTGKISLHMTPVDLADVAEHCVEAMRAHAEARQLRLSIANTAAHAMVRGDGVRLEQVVNNLLSNAIKYTPPGGEIAVTVERDGDDVVLRVRDSGKGISAEMLTRIFDLFMQGDTTIDRSEGGMGVGLTLVKKLVHLHRGSVRAYSRGAGSGSEFVVRLPMTASTSAAAARSKAAPAAATPRHILVIEDNADIRDLLRMKLRQLGHKVEAAEDGTKGLEQLLASPSEVALVDIGLPGIDGYEIARRAREQLGDRVYLVALTGYGQVEDKEKALAAGFDVHLTKPTDFVDLQNVLALATPGDNLANSHHGERRR